MHSLQGPVLALSDKQDQPVTLFVMFRFITIVQHQAGRRVWSFGQVRHLPAAAKLWAPHQLASWLSVHMIGLIGVEHIKRIVRATLQVSTKQQQLERLHWRAS